MIDVTVFLGSSIDEGSEFDTFQMPAVPRVGDLIRQVEGNRHIVKEVEFFLKYDRSAAVRILVQPEKMPSKYNLNAFD